MQPIEKVFADGMFFKRPREGAPDFVKGAVSIKVAEFIPFIEKHAKEGWVNLDLKESKGGKLYLELNTWEKSGATPEPSNLSQADKDAIKAIKEFEDMSRKEINPNNVTF